MAKTFGHGVSLRQIGERAGVSITTVSRVLSGTPNRISQKTQEEIRKIAEEMGYRPNLLVRGIQRGRTGMIGVMVPPADSYWSEVLYGIHDELSGADHVPLVLWSSHRIDRVDKYTPLEQIYRMIDRRIDGVLLWPQFAALYGQHVREFSSRRLPVVTIDHRINETDPIDHVANDEEVGIRQAMEHLISLGHKRIGHMMGRRVYTWEDERVNAFLQVCQAHGIEHVIEEMHQTRSRLDTARALLSRHPRPTAILAASDHLALACYQAAAELKIRIPQELSIIGAGDLDISSQALPPLTTLRQEPYEIGRLSARLLLERLQDETLQVGPRVVRLPLKLVIRASTAAPLGHKVIA